MVNLSAMYVVPPLLIEVPCVTPDTSITLSYNKTTSVTPMTKQPLSSCLKEVRDGRKVGILNNVIIGLPSKRRQDRSHTGRECFAV